VKNLGFNLAYRWQEGFFWQNSFAIGDIDSYSTLDAQINYKIESIKTMVKLGATNLFGDEYVTNVGGPNIGSLYYISLTFDEFMR
jgi:outer membrane receptor protein involved in Fe transport